MKNKNEVKFFEKNKFTENMYKKQSFEAIKKSINNSIKFSSKTVILAEGDSLEILKSLPSHSISLILTDPPYHSTKKENILGDTSFKEDAHYIGWLSKYANEWHRILKPNGSLFCFCASDLAAKLEIEFSNKFNILSNIVWTKPNDPGFDGWKQKMKKEALRQWYPHSERIIFAEPAYDGNMFRSYFGSLLRTVRKKSGLTTNQLTEKIGAYGTINHGGAVSNWEAGRNIPTQEQYKKICDAVINTGKVGKMPSYEDVIRTFRTNGSDIFTDIWSFQSVRPHKDKHPAEKPLDLLMHAIKSTTNEGDIVLDCFSGSGNTGIAARDLGRLAILIDIDPKWVSKSKTKLNSKNKSITEF